MNANNSIYNKNVYGSNQAQTNPGGACSAAPPPVPAPNPVATEAVDSDSGLEVVEEPSLRPSELVRGNHNSIGHRDAKDAKLTLSIYCFMFFFASVCLSAEPNESNALEQIYYVQLLVLVLGLKL